MNADDLKPYEGRNVRIHLQDGTQLAGQLVQVSSGCIRLIESTGRLHDPTGRTTHALPPAYVSAIETAQ